MSEERAARRGRVYTACFMALYTGMVFLSGCGRGADGAVGTGLAASGTASSAAAPARRVARAGKAARATVPLLGPGEKRVALFVVPGDALVEVDGQLVARRNGVVELVGKVGDTHRVRVFKGARSTEEKIVTLRETGASPAELDLFEPGPQGAGGPAKPKAVLFGFDER